MTEPRASFLLSPQYSVLSPALFDHLQRPCNLLLRVRIAILLRRGKTVVVGGFGGVQVVVGFVHLAELKIRVTLPRVELSHAMQQFESLGISDFFSSIARA